MADSGIAVCLLLSYAAVCMLSSMVSEQNFEDIKNDFWNIMDIIKVNI